MKSKKEVVEYYDEYTGRQADMGINARHLSIQRWLEQSGLQKNHDILEIGCGIGTQTELLSNYLNASAKITAVDISPKSIEVAKKRLPNRTDIKWVAEDFIVWPHNDLYDVVLLPDVIEHIPVDLHSELFRKISTNIKDNGFVLIHIPNPLYLEWCRVNTPKKLQVIDQPIHTDTLVGNTYPHGFHIHFLSTYSIWVDNCDYTVIVLKKTRNVQYRKYQVTIPSQSIAHRAVSKLKGILKG